MSNHRLLASDSATDALAELIPGGPILGSPFTRRRSQ